MSYCPTACSECLRRARLLLALAPYIEECVTAKGSALPLLSLPNEQLAATVAHKDASQLLARNAAFSDEELQSEIAESGYWCCCRHDPQFPVALRGIPNAPWALFGKGAPLLLARLGTESAVAIVGSRRSTSYGRGVARKLGHDLAQAGLTVVSGLGHGIEACAHRGALEGGMTAAVLATGVDNPFPASHRPLWQHISESGLVLSELPLGYTPWPWTFAARGRIVAALTGMTIVVEAAEESGSLVVADLAARLGRRVGAVPGQVTCRVAAGTNDLLAGGDCVIRDARDVLDAMFGPGTLESGPPGRS